MTFNKKICLFGLSADPPTGYGGHVGIVQALKQMGEWDEIWVLPVYRHTFAVRRWDPPRYGLL
jgi:nicotinic acid mononucleotide adenylyltransferase